METTKRQQMTMIFSFALRSKAVAFQKELERLGIASRKITKLRHEYAVTTDTRAMEFAPELNKFLYSTEVAKRRSDTPPGCKRSKATSPA